MSGSERVLALFLQIAAALLLTAIVPAVMPFAWMDAIHRWLGMGKLPEGPIVGYLTRSLSLFYAAHGLMLLILAFDVRRYARLLQYLAAVVLAFGAGMLAIDLWEGLPPFWILGEGPFIIVLAAVLGWLARRVERG